MNKTEGILDVFSPNIEGYPFYYTSRPAVFSFLSDRQLSLAAPFLAYWFLSLFFHLLDLGRWPWIEKFRIQEPDEVVSRNKATVGQVVRSVLLQQILQTVGGLWWLNSLETEGDYIVDHNQAMKNLYRVVFRALEIFIGWETTRDTLDVCGPALVSILYWWFIPIIQLLFALLFMDTWQYFIHRFFHTNQYLYRTIHSVHHRLYVPYAFGALYNHWLEGLLLDTLGAAVAHSLASMSMRQAILLFTIATLKTVDDHCGYSLPFDPFQILFPNKAAYHDIHHRIWGIKYNFSQPFFIHWDVILNTRYRGAPPTKTKHA
ncbi:hypothetical protein BS47DRAFT_1330171 [Hydnum rufescens UP504]|uniref:Fatty acid hydroxylase domain-containing protein n=1 Tax=Hydnum rufescens UP504 TaxID=1448309 RepID=A0A9P6AVF4_9AGAM|nr:hypothetical protein BS47DRAFT_1330171 [Hydnum rufescens UP504]